MQDGIVVGNMSMEEFKVLRAGKGAGTLPSPQRLAILALEPGNVIILAHTEVGCNLGGEKSRYCNLSQMTSYANKHGANGRLFMSRHLPDGNVAIGCVAKPE